MKSVIIFFKIIYLKFFLVFVRDMRKVKHEKNEYRDHKKNHQYCNVDSDITTEYLILHPSFPLPSAL